MLHSLRETWQVTVTTEMVRVYSNTGVRRYSRNNLGMLVDTIKGEFRVPPSKLARIRALAT